MKRAIYEFDLPEDCYDCPFAIIEGRVDHCFLIEEELEIEMRHKDCPLKIKEET